MQKHKWYNEIVAWASGAEIEYKVKETGAKWYLDEDPKWNDFGIEYRIKPQEQQSGCCCKQTCSAPKETQYLYVYEDIGGINITSDKNYATKDMEYIGKIKLEQDE